MPDYSNTRIQLRRGSAAAWASANTVLGEGEPGFSINDNSLKIGDGVTTYANLSGITGGGGGISNVVEDTTPQLGGNLDLNSKDITGNGDFLITGSGVITETMDNHCGFIIKSNSDTNGELHFGSCADSAGVGNAMGLRHSSGMGANDYIIMANTDGNTYVSAKDTKTLTLSAGGHDGDTKLELRDATLGFRFNVNKSDVDLQYSGDNETSLFYIDAGTDRIGIKSDVPSHSLSVSGTLNANEVYVSGSPAVFSSPTQAGDTASTNVSGIQNIVFTDAAGYAALSKDANTIYFVV